MSGCCDEYNCKRKKPIKLFKGDFTNEWYVATAYNGNVATTKHKLEDSVSKRLNALFEQEQELVELRAAYEQLEKKNSVLVKSVTIANEQLKGYLPPNALDFKKEKR